MLRIGVRVDKVKTQDQRIGSVSVVMASQTRFGKAVRRIQGTRCVVGHRDLQKHKSRTEVGDSHRCAEERRAGKGRGLDSPVVLPPWARKDSGWCLTPAGSLVLAEEVGAPAAIVDARQLHGSTQVESEFIALEGRNAARPREAAAVEEIAASRAELRKNSNTSP